MPATTAVAEIPTGPATIMGQVLVAVLTASAGIAAVLHGDHTTGTLISLGGALVTAMTLMAGRFAQSVAQIRADGVVRAAASPATDAGAGAAPGSPSVVVHCCCCCCCERAAGVGAKPCA